MTVLEFVSYENNSEILDNIKAYEVLKTKTFL